MFILLLILSWISVLIVYALMSYCTRIPEFKCIEEGGVYFSLSFFDHFQAVFKDLRSIRDEEIFDIDRLFDVHDKWWLLRGRAESAQNNYEKSKNEFDKNTGSAIFLLLFCLVGIGYSITSITHYSWWVYTALFASWLVPIALFEAIVNNKLKITYTLFMDRNTYLFEDMCERARKEESENTFFSEDEGCTLDGFTTQYEAFYELSERYYSSKIHLIGSQIALMKRKNKAFYALIAAAVFILALNW